jgi:hypothetical protein
MGGPDRHLGKDDAVAPQPVQGFGDDIAAVELDRGAELLEGKEVQIDRPGADGAAAGERDAGVTAAGDQRAEDPEACPHARHQLIGCLGVDDGFGDEMDGLAVAGILAGALAVDLQVGPVVAQDAEQHLHVGQAGHVT